MDFLVSLTMVHSTQWRLKGLTDKRRKKKIVYNLSDLMAAIDQGCKEVTWIDRGAPARPELQEVIAKYREMQVAFVNELVMGLREKVEKKKQ